VGFFLSGHSRFFLGSDSAPHVVTKKAMATPSQPCAAGVYTAPILLPLVAHLLESFGALDQLVAFSSTNGRAFYKVETENLRSVTLRREPFRIMESLSLKGDDIVPFWAGRELNWSIASDDAST
jgi:dihydroorotase